MSLRCKIGQMNGWMHMSEWNEGDALVLDMFLANYEGANVVTFGGSAQWSASATVVDGASKETGTNSLLEGQ